MNQKKAEDGDGSVLPTSRVYKSSPSAAAGGAGL